MLQIRHLLNFVLSIGLLAAALLGGNEAQAANSVKFKLTAVVKMPEAENPPGIFENEVEQIKITNKEMLDFLAAHYAGANAVGNVLSLDSNGNFVILDADGALVYDVAALYLDWSCDDTVRYGTDDDVRGLWSMKILGPGRIEMQSSISNFFEIYGSCKGPSTKNYVTNKSSWNRALALAGNGRFSGLDTYFAGKVLVQFGD